MPHRRTHGLLNVTTASSTRAGCHQFQWLNVFVVRNGSSNFACAEGLCTRSTAFLKPPRDRSSPISAIAVFGLLPAANTTVLHSRLRTPQGVMPDRGSPPPGSPPPLSPGCTPGRRRFYLLGAVPRRLIASQLCRERPEFVQLPKAACSSCPVPSSSPSSTSSTPNPDFPLQPPVYEGRVETSTAPRTDDAETATRRGPDLPTRPELSSPAR